MSPVTSAVTWWRRRSLRARLTAAAVLVIALAITLSAVLLTVRLRSALVAGVDEAALDRAEAVATAVAAGRGLPAGMDDDELIQVVTPDGQVLASSVGGPAAPSLLTAPPRRQFDVRTQVGVALPGERDEAYRVVTLPARSPDADVRLVQVALPLDDAQESVEELAAALVVGTPAVVAVLAVLTWLLVGRALRPVDALRRQAADIPGTALDQRLTVPESGDELARLAETFNALLARVEAATARQRAFLADAAHEIRSPLASLRTQLEVAGLHHDAQWREQLPHLVEDSQRLSRLVDDLLRLARLDAGAPLARAAVDLDEIVLTAARRIRETTDVAVDTSGVSGARVAGDADALNRVVQNLLDNAVRHARTAVTIALTASDRVTLTVADDGPGIPDQLRNHVFERFTRLDDARSRDAGGTGLGLAIVRDTVTQHGGSVRIEDGQPGARLVVDLPSRT